MRTASALLLAAWFLMPLEQPGFIVDLDSKGGFTGRGYGRVALWSDGRVRATRMGGLSANPPSGCPAALTAAENENLGRAVASATRQPWPASFEPPGKGCCGRVRWTLRLQRRAGGGAMQTFVTAWHDGNEQYLSTELRAIRDIAVELLTRTLAACPRG